MKLHCLKIDDHEKELVKTDEDALFYQVKIKKKLYILHIMSNNNEKLEE